MNGAAAVTAMAKYLAGAQDVPVFKYEKAPKTTGEYIVVNSLPFSYGSHPNTKNIINVNVHVPDLQTTQANTARLTELAQVIESLIPVNSSYEEDTMLSLNDAAFCIANDSNMMADTDGTHFINFKINVIF